MNLFDQFLATQGQMKQNQAADISNQFNLAKLGQLKTDQANEAQSRQLGMEIAKANMAKQNPTAPTITLANLADDQPEQLSGPGMGEAKPETVIPATAKVPKQSEVLSQQADELKASALKFGAIGNLKQQDALMKESVDAREKVYLSQKEERTAEAQKMKEASGAMYAISKLPVGSEVGQAALNDLWNKADAQHRQGFAPYFNIALEGKPIYDTKAKEALDLFGMKSLDAGKQLELQVKSLNEQIASQRAETDRLRQVATENYQNSETARKREGDASTNARKDADLRMRQNKADPFGMFAPATEGFSGTIGKDGEIDIPNAPALKTALGSQTHGEAFLKVVPPALQSTILQIAEGRGPMPPQGRNDPTNKMIRMMVNQYDPNYREGDYASGAAAEKAFTAGRLGSTVRSFNVATQHLDTLQKAADALENGDIPAFNTVGNYIAKQTGKPAPTDFNATKRIVADEIVKSIVGGQNALADREDAAKSVDAANSPAQLSGVIKKYKELMAGQLVGLEKQYEASTKKTDFRQRFLTTESLSDISSLAPQRRAGDSLPKKSADIISAADKILAGK